jgi:ABC-type transport system involved in multi-copper enzyme maturation permease subunit
MIVGTLLLIILAGTIVGGEYSGGTVRLILTRGPTRTQFLISKIGASFLCVVSGFVMLVLTGLGVGALLTLPSGIATPLNFLQHGGWVHALLYPLIALFGLFVCTMLALFLATLGRATVAGVAGTLLWFVLESVLSGVLNLLPPGSVVNFLKAVPDYFISNNISLLLHSQTNYFISDPYFAVNAPSTSASLHALLVLLIYLVIFIVLSLWVSICRDITN